MLLRRGTLFCMLCQSQLKVSTVKGWTVPRKHNLSTGLGETNTLGYCFGNNVIEPQQTYNTLQSASHEQRSDQQEAEAEEMSSSTFNKSFVSMLYR